MPKMKIKSFFSLEADLQTRGLTVVLELKMAKNSIFSCNKCEKQHQTVLLYIAKGFKLN